MRNNRISDEIYHLNLYSTYRDIVGLHRLDNGVYTNMNDINILVKTKNTKLYCYAIKSREVTV